MQYLHQKKVTNSLKEEWHKLVSNKAPFKQRQEIKRQIKEAKALLAQYKDAIHNTHKEKEATKELKSLYDNIDQRGVIKKIAKSYEDKVPGSEHFTFTMLRGRTDSLDSPRIYIGRYSHGAPSMDRRRIGFITEISISNKTKLEREIKDILTVYFNENRLFFGDVKILFLSKNVGSDRVWGVSGTTQKHNILGFQELQIRSSTNED